MKKKIIKINDISQIDTAKVSVYDFNNRYIDPSGNIYGLKHDKINRKIEVIKLRRYGAKESYIYQQMASRNKLIDLNSDLLEQENIEDGKNINEDGTPYDPQIFIDKVINFVETHKARTLGIIKNIDESGIIEKENKHELNEFNDIIRNLEISGIQQLERLETYYKELTNYPRTITFYQAKMDNAQKRIFEQIAANKEQSMRFIYLYEMSSNIQRVYSNLKKFIEQLEKLTADKNFDEKSTVTKFHKQSFFDARTSLENTLADIDEILRENIELNEFASNVNNFK